MPNRYPAGLRPTPVEPPDAAPTAWRPAPLACSRCGHLLRDDPPSFTPQDPASILHPLCRRCRVAVLHG